LRSTSVIFDILYSSRIAFTLTPTFLSLILRIVTLHSISRLRVRYSLSLLSQSPLLLKSLSQLRPPLFLLLYIVFL